MTILYLVLAVVIIGGFILFQFLRNVQPSEGLVSNDIKELKTMLQDWHGGFEPWTADTIEDLSVEQVDKVRKGNQVKTGQGVFVSVDNNPMFAYAYKSYVGPGKNAVIYAMTSSHEFVYRLTNTGVKFQVDEQQVGRLRRDGLLYNDRNKAIAGVSNKSLAPAQSLIIEGEEIAKLNNPHKMTEAGDRRALKLQKDLSEENKALFQSLTIYELVENELSDLL